MSFQDSDSNRIFDLPKISVQVNYVVKAIENYKSAGSDGSVGELIKHRGNTICEMLLTLFNLVSKNEYVPT